MDFNADGFLRIVGNACGSIKYAFIPDTVIGPVTGDDLESVFPETYSESADDLDMTVPLPQDMQLVFINENGFCSYQFSVQWTPLATSGTSANADTATDLSLGPCQGEYTIYFHDHDYQLVEIGGQCWFAENLRYLPFVGPSDELESKISVQGYYGVDVEEAKNTEAYIEYGAWYEANIWDIEGIQLCPVGWSVPTVAQVEILMEEVSWESGPLKTTGWSEIGLSDWLYPNYGATNSTGFSATPGGFGEYESDGTTMRMAVSTWQFSGNWGNFELDSNGGWVWNGHEGYNNVTIRCIKD